MRRVVVIGSGGAGKSTFARELGKITGLPVLHLDSLFWKPDWTRTPESEWSQVIRNEIAKPEWIMDGNFGGTREMRIAAADTIVFLDLPRWVCMYRIIKRSVRYRNRTRPDMAEGCIERIDLEFLAWVWNYRKRSRRRALDEMERSVGKDTFVLKRRSDVKHFLDRVRQAYGGS